MTEDFVRRFDRMRALHGPIVAAGNRVIVLADVRGQESFWLLAETPVLVGQARRLIAAVEARWQGFPMSNELKAILATLEDEIVKLESKR